MQAKMKRVFIAEDPGTSQKPSVHGINANRWVTSIIRDGYALPFVELPLTKDMENHKSTWDEKQIVAEQI